jgi:hypothetical protein
MSSDIFVIDGSDVITLCVQSEGAEKIRHKEERTNEICNIKG